MRISIIGHAGSGKSTLARRISEKFSIPYIELDRFWLESGGLKVEYGVATAEERDKIRAKTREKALAAISAENWVSDGYYKRIQPEITERADSIVYLNAPLVRRLWGHARRIKPGRHPEITLWREFTFFLEMIRRTYTKGPALQRFVEEQRNKVV